MRFFDFTKPGPGVSAPPPASGFARFRFLMRTYFWHMVRLALLTALFSLPVVTLPAALAGAVRVAMKWTRDGFCLLWTEFIEEFRHSFFKALCLFAAILPAIGLILAYRYAGGILLFLLSMAAGVVSILFLCYALPMLAIVAIPFRAVAGNALLLLLSEHRTNVYLVAAVIVPITLLVMLSPFSLIVFLFGGFGASLLGACMLVNRPLSERIIASEGSASENGGAG